MRGALARIGLAAHEATAEGIWWRLKICASDECEWAYYDHSKNRSRNWCEYGCGNKLKTRAYRARQAGRPPRPPSCGRGGRVAHRTPVTISMTRPIRPRTSGATTPTRIPRDEGPGRGQLGDPDLGSDPVAPWQVNVTSPSPVSKRATAVHSL